MRQLSPLDVQFLNVEDETTFAHVGCLVLLDPSALPGGALTREALRDRVAARLDALGPFRWRLSEVPLGLDLPYWEEVTPDLDVHVLERSVPGPGDDDALCRLVGELASVPLDRSLPLWQVTLLHDLTDGRQAVYLKVHHSAVDGVSVADVLGVLTDESADADATGDADGGSMTGESAGGAPSALGALGRAAWNVAARSADLVRSAPRLVPHLLDLPGAVGVPGVGPVVGVVSTVARRVGVDLPGVPTDAVPAAAPDTPLNGPITAGRGLGIGSVPLAEVKRVKDALGLTVNDVVLAVSTTALRGWLLERDALPEEPLLAAVPVSVRTEAEAGRGGNQVSIMLVELPTHLADAGERVQVLHDSVQAAKERFAAVPPKLLGEWAAALPQTGGGVASRLVMRLAGGQRPIFTLFVSNVPGPQHALHCAGARVLAVHPVSAVSEVGGAMNITVMSYDGHVDVGVVVCDDRVPDVAAFTASLVSALDELSDLAVAHP
ncbi:wax ester/triacylglycerol synthase family O-acyltransferase [Rhodococcus aerolatus]